MAIALFQGRRSRLERLEARERNLMAREQRISSPLTFSGEPFVGFGDSAFAENILDAVKGSASQALGVIRDRIQGLPLGVFVRRFVNGDFEDTPAFGHPLQRILNNPTFDPVTGSITHSAQQIFGMVVSQYLAVGECYLPIIKNGLVPIGLQIAQPGAIEPIVRGGRIAGYRAVSVTGDQRIFATDDLVRIWIPDDFELFSARGVMVKNKDEVNLDAFSLQTWEKFYKFDATPKLAMETDSLDADLPTEEEQKSFASSWIRKFHRRLGNQQGSPAFVSMPGWKLKELSSQMDAQSGVTMMTWTTQQVFEAFRVSPSLIGRNVDVNRAAAETARFTFDQNTVEPITRIIAEALTLQLASLYPQTTEGVELVVKYLPFIARDKEFELRKDQIDAASFIRNVNEIRDDREPALDSASWGDLPLGPFGIGPITGELEEDIDLSQFGLEESPETPPAVPVEGTETEEAATPEEERTRGRGLHFMKYVRAHFEPEREWRRVIQREKMFTPLFASRQRAIFKRQTEITIERYLESQGDRTLTAILGRGIRVNENPEDLAKEIFPIPGWGDLFRTTVVPVRSAAFLASANEATDAITGEVFRFTQAAREILERQNFAHYVFINQTSQDTLASVLQEALDDGLGADDTARLIASKLNESSKVRAKQIARTEMAAATQEAQTEGYRQTGVVERRMWNTSLDAAVRDSHTIEGQTVGLDEPFTLANGSQGDSPGAVDFPVGDRVNCRCFITPVFFDEDALSVIGG